MNNKYFFFIISITLFFACNQVEDNYASLIIINANIATMDKDNPSAEAIAVRDGKIIAIGSNEEIQDYATNNTSEYFDAKGKFLMPGFIEGHGHMGNLGKSLLKLNLLNTTSWEQIVKMVEKKVKEAKPGEWIEGRGWHQEKWTSTPDKNVLGYPYHDLISKISPDNPVILRHASGHSVFANKKAMEAAQVSIETPNPKGGLIVRGDEKEAIGVFEERAMDIVYAAYQEYLDGLDQDKLAAEWLQGIRLAEDKCLENGITSFQDAGSTFWEIDKYEKLAEEDSLNVRLYVMLRHPYEEMKDKLEGFPKINKGKDFFTCRAVKSQVDGALGAYGAWLLKSYNDKIGFLGQNTTTIAEVQNVADMCFENKMQLCVHAIGDRANREVLDIFENKIKKYKGSSDEMRWRIEHAQHVNQADIPRFGQSGIIASMQGIHCTSDSPFVPKRLGHLRSQKESYPWRSLIDSGAKIANGTDVPVEDISAIDCFYASVTRKRKDSKNAFFPEQCMTRQEALESYTIN
ncbi:MAG: amidohydrolase, partial [Saprospiraceae bacterium]